MVELLAAAGTNTNEGAVVAVNLALLLAFAAGALKCAAIMSRPEAHKLCVGSLAIVLLMGVLGIVLTTLRVLFSLPTWLYAIALLLIAMGLLIAWILALVGLFDYRRRADEFLQGRVQAWMALALSTLPLCFVSFSFAYGVVEGIRVAAERDANEGTIGQPLPAAEEPSDDSMMSVMDRIIRAESKRPETQRFEKFNFTFTPQGGDWVKLPAANVNPDASIAYMGKSPQTLFFIIAERGGADLPIDSQSLCEVAKANSQLNSENAVIGIEMPRTIDGVDGMEYDAVLIIAGQERCANYWIASKGGFQYQVITTGDARDSKEIRERHESMLAGFKVIDADAIVYSDGVEPVNVYESPQHGFRIDLRGDAWTHAPPTRKLSPGAEMVAVLRDRASIAVVPLRLPLDDIPLDDVANALAAIYIDGFDPTQRADVQSKQTATGGELSFICRGTGVASSGLGFRVRVLKHGRQAIASYGWAEANDTAAIAAVEKGLQILTDYDATTSDAMGTVEQRFDRGIILNQIGLLTAARGELAIAAACFEEALGYQPKNATMLLNFAQMLREQGEAERALAELESRMEEFGSDFSVREAFAAHLYEAGDEKRAGETLEKLLADGSKNEDVLAMLSTILTTKGDERAALAAVDRFLLHGPSAMATQLRGSLLLRLGEYAAAIELLEETRKSRPKDLSNLIYLAAAYVGAEQYQQSLEVTQQLLDMEKASEDIYILRGRCQLGLKDHQKAKESFELALALSPQSAEAHEWVALASAMLGQGNNSLVKTPIDPVPMPTDILERLANLPLNDESAGPYGAYERYRVVGYDYRPGERWRSTNYQKIKIVSQAGVDRYVTLSIDFDPVSERVYVNRLAVIDAAGIVVAEGNPNDYFVVEAQGQLATGDNTLTIPIPQLKAGNTVEFNYTRERVVADEFGYEEVLLTSVVPVQAAALFIIGDVEAVAHMSSGPSVRHAADGSLVWEVSDPAAYVAEYGQPPFADFLPAIRLSDANQEWGTVGDDYCDLIADRLKPDPIVAETVKSVTTGLANDQEKIAALSRYVQRQLNYQGVEFGVRGLMPNGAARTLANGYGDCKDHSLLLKQLLDAAGIPAQLALVSSLSDGDRSLPSVSQFDHMIVSLPRGSEDNRIFLDCTAKHSDPSQATADDFAGKYALILEPGASRLVEIKPRAFIGTEIRCGREVTITYDDPAQETADATIRENVTFNANAAAGLRQAFIGMKPHEREETMAGLISEQGDVEVSRLEIKNLEESSEPLTIDCEYRIDDLFHRVGGAGSPLSGRLPSPWEAFITNQLVAKERITPFRTSSARLTSSTRFALPKGFAFERQLESVPTPEGNQFFKWRIEANPAVNESVVHLERRAGHHAATSFGAYMAEGKKLTSQLRRPISIREVSR